MSTNRRRFIALSMLAAASSTTPAALARQREVTSGGIGLTLADVRSIYEELPPGQSFRPFADPEFGTSLYMDFGEDDLVQTIWVGGNLTEESARQLITSLCPDDFESAAEFVHQNAAGSIATHHSQLHISDWLGSVSGGRSMILASYNVLPSGGSEPPTVERLILSVQQASS